MILNSLSSDIGPTRIHIVTLQQLNRKVAYANLPEETLEPKELFLSALPVADVYHLSSVILTESAKG